MDLDLIFFPDFDREFGLLSPAEDVLPRLETLPLFNLSGVLILTSALTSTSSITLVSDSWEISFSSLFG